MKLAHPLILLLALGGCGTAPPQPTAWQLPLRDALQRLQRADLSGFQAAENCGHPFDITASTNNQDSITWDVSSGLFHVASFTVHLEADGATATRAIIDVPADPQGGEIYDGNGKHYDHPMLLQPLRPALEELVASAMEERRFDASRMPPHMPDDACSANRPLAHQVEGVSAAPAPAPSSISTPAPGPTEEAAPEPVAPVGVPTGYPRD